VLRRASLRNATAPRFGIFLFILLPVFLARVPGTLTSRRLPVARVAGALAVRVALPNGIRIRIERAAVRAVGGPGIFGSLGSLGTLGTVGSLGTLGTLGIVGTLIAVVG